MSFLQKKRLAKELTQKEEVYVEPEDYLGDGWIQNPVFGSIGCNSISSELASNIYHQDIVDPFEYEQMQMQGNSSVVSTIVDDEEDNDGCPKFEMEVFQTAFQSPQIFQCHEPNQDAGGDNIESDASGMSDESPPYDPSKYSKND